MIGLVSFIVGTLVITSAGNDTEFSLVEPVSYVEFFEANGNPFEFGFELTANQTPLVNIKGLSYLAKNGSCMKISSSEIDIYQFANFQIPKHDYTNRTLRIASNGNVTWERVSRCGASNIFIFATQLFIDFTILIIPYFYILCMLNII